VKNSVLGLPLLPPVSATKRPRVGSHWNFLVGFRAHRLLWPPAYEMTSVGAGGYCGASHSVNMPRCIRHGLWFRNFLDGVVRTTRRARIRWGGEARDDTFRHEPALVARCCSPAKLLLGFPKFVGIPRCNDHRRHHPCCWHSQGGPAAMASCRTSEQLRRVGDRNDPTTERLQAEMAECSRLGCCPCAPHSLGTSASRCRFWFGNSLTDLDGS
jgi:hypothetical protein